MKIYRKKVIQALINEPLRAGSFFYACSKPSEGETPVETCPVCAVGAVIRSHLKDYYKYRSGRLNSYGMTLTKGVFIGAPVEDLLREKNYLGALSCFFEEMLRALKVAEPSAKQRLELIEFVINSFPPSFEVEDLEV